MIRNIVIYQDKGAGDFGISCLQSFFKNDSVRFAAAESVIDNSAFHACDIFIMPGGADLPYCRKLNGAGNRNIRAFVENGGTYLGICAGAYYACSSIEYHKGRSDEICQDRELALIDAIAIGSLPELAPYYDDTLKTASIATLDLNGHGKRLAFYYGGPLFSLHETDEDTCIVGRYADLPDTPAAIVTKLVGAGRVILSGVHIEVSPEYLAHRAPEEDGDDVRIEILCKELSVAVSPHNILNDLLKAL